ncbi:MAG: immunoglobulin-like domain-containing protein [Clostridium sp.]|uniref:immunoglobulin-like domain-containing protein n=1 Tax=Clostridium sp. TaxID=1506 RepID=UPI00399B97EC
MIQKRFENRATRRNNKKKKNKRFVNLMAISTVTAVIFVYSINGVADNKKVNNKVTVELGVEKIEKDKVKIKLDNFTPVIKSLQLSLKIDGNAKFKENSIEWLVKSKSNDIKTHTKISDDKKSMEIFIISNEPLDKNGGELEICEINVTKDGNGSSAYTINANVNNDGNSYSYIINDTNKQVSGNDIANLNIEKLTINSYLVISLKNLATVVDGNIFVSKGEDFDAKSYIVVNDEEDGEIPVDKVVVESDVDTTKVGNYKVIYSVTDSNGATTTKTINVKVSMKMVELEPSNPIKPEKPDEPTTPGNPELPDNPSIPENPDDSGNDNSGNINKPGNGSGSDDKVEAPDVPVTPETPKDDNSNTSTDNKVNSENKNEIPKTGQGIFYGITITFAVLIIGFGVYFLKKKNK